MLTLVIKTVLLYIIMFFAIRLMGQKQSGQLQPYELIITLMIAEVATTPMDDPGTPLFYGVVPAITLLLMYSFLSYICIKSKKLSTFIRGNPSILIHNGKILYDEIKKIGYDLNDLIEQLRMSGTTDISSIHYAILETNGELSVLPYARFLPLTPMDMEISAVKSTLHSSIIVDGKLSTSNLSRFSIDAGQVRALLASLGYREIKQILLFTVTDTGEAFLQDKAGSTRTFTLGKSWIHA